MRIISAKGEFDLPVGFTLNITAFNQMFNSEGEQSVPVTLPPSPKNLAILRFPHRVDSFYKPISEISVDVIDDVFMRPARMVVHSANETEGISCTIYFSEASFYALIDEKTMQDVQLDVINGVGDTHGEKVQYLITMLKNEYLNQTSNLFSVFPVLTNHQVKRDFVYKKYGPDPTNPGNLSWQDIVYSEEGGLILNGFKTNYFYEPDASPEKNIMLDVFQGEVAQTIIQNGESISIAQGYGMTPFVDLFYFIQQMFDHLGYSFDDTDLRALVNSTDGKLVMLNNVADAIYDGSIDLNQLVPKMTLKDFIKSISIYFGGVFYVDEVARSVAFYGYDAVFTLNIRGDLSRYMSSPLRIEGLDFKKLALFNTAEPDTARRADTDYIEVNLPGESSLVMRSHGQTSNGTRYTNYERHVFEISMPAINNVIHLNSSMVKSTGVDADREKDSSQELLLAGVRKGVLASGSMPYFYWDLDTGWELYNFTYNYYKGYAAIYRLSDNAFDFLKTLYQPYINWNEDSNITVSCQMHLPPDVLYSLDLSAQYIIDGQLFFIDQIKYNLPYDAKQTLTLRTYRKYENTD